ncbi:vWA domain-containing protein [Saccharomonospora cyanea]|uniref:von Willebrand factor type A-like protein n=1 Tax=Saccharomonospora cyanea NA-134 TaxID=882082 RepID=H5XI35_9PSEU|nr:substrate-binding domain-containing protein [Saccharomonospora cyanea]EHR60665.1 von Willebrand factor type A-like protein [Saccharomonospora cyanea NA-134]
MTVGRTVPLVVGSLVGIIGVIGAVLVPSASVDYSDCVSLRVNSSTEKGDLVTVLADEYNSEKHVVEGRCAEVRVNKLTSGEAAQHLAEGWDASQAKMPRPDVWLPSTSLWAGLAELRSDRTLFTGENDSITTSPLVIGMPRKMAVALGWPDKHLGWSDLRNLARNPDWTAHGHPEWGLFAMGKDKPPLSSSGLAATIAAYHAAAGNPAQLTEGHLTDSETLEFVRDVESSVVHYSEDSVTFLGNLYVEDQKGTGKPYISAMIMQEQMVYAYNQGAPTGNPSHMGRQRRPNDPLVAIQPADSTVVLDHPFLVLDHVSDEQHAVAEHFRDFLLEREQQDRFIEHGFRDSEGRTSGDVADSVGTTPQLTTDAVGLPGPEVVDLMLDVWQDRIRIRGNVLLLLDVSGSMNEPIDPGAPGSTTKLDLLKPVVKQALDLLDEEINVALWTLTTAPEHVVREQLRPIGEARQELLALVDDLEADGETNLYDATHAAYQAMGGKIDPNHFNAIVLLTDGRDTARGGVSRQELLDAVTTEDVKTSVRIFTIAYGGDADRATLDAIATATKARAYDPSNLSDISQVFRSVFSHF